MRDALTGKLSSNDRGGRKEGLFEVFAVVLKLPA